MISNVKPTRVISGRHATRGFTMVEVLIYISVLVITAVAAVTLLLSLSDTYKTYRAEQLVFRSAHTALERFLFDVRNSQEVTAIGSPQPTSITLSGNAGTRTYALVGNQIILSEDGTTIGQLTGDDVDVDELYFYYYASSTNAVRVTMRLNSTVGSTTVTKRFSAGAVMRQSYE